MRLARVFEDNMKTIQHKLNKIEEERDSILEEAHDYASNHNEVENEEHAKEVSAEMVRLGQKVAKVIEEEIALIGDSGVRDAAKAPRLNEVDCRDVWENFEGVEETVEKCESLVKKYNALVEDQVKKQEGL